MEREIEEFRTWKKTKIRYQIILLMVVILLLGCFYLDYQEGKRETQTEKTITKKIICKNQTNIIKNVEYDKNDELKKVILIQDFPRRDLFIIKGEFDQECNLKSGVITDSLTGLTSHIKQRKDY